mgnify:CR=1 FL=1
MAKKKVVLLYSGGLDTSVMLKWLQDELNYDVICYCSDLGQADEDQIGQNEIGRASCRERVLYTV